MSIIKDFCDIGRGIKHDLERRLPWYTSDWMHLTHRKTWSSFLFILFTSIAPAITFGLYLSQSTNDELGAIEVLLSMSIVGILFSLFAGQPLVIVGVTGPTAFLTASIYTISKAFGLPFIPFYAWSQLWAALLHMIMGVCNLCDLVSIVTRYSCETFGILIALIYLYTGLDGIATMFTDTSQNPLLASSLLQFIIAIGTVLTAIYLSNAKHWTVFNDSIRMTIADYGPSIAVIAWSTVPYMQTRLDVNIIPTLFVPLDFHTTSGRAWFVDLGSIPAWGVFAAIFPGFIITILFFFDHNVSSLIAQDRLFKLQKGSAYHWDFFILGVGLILSGVLGLPPNNGLIPQAPLHVKSLMIEVIQSQQHTSNDIQLQEKEVIVLEQRWTNLFQSIGCGLLTIFPFAVALRLIPTAVLYGLFLFLGLASFEGNEFARRINLLIMDHTLRPDPIPPLTHTRVAYFTVIQAMACAIIFGVTFTPAEVVFPVLIALVVVLRLYILSRLFTLEELALLDSSIIEPSIDKETIEKEDEEKIPESPDSVAERRPVSNSV